MNGAAPVLRAVWLAAIALLLALAAAAIWRLNARPAAPPGPVEVLRLAVNAAYVGSCPVLAARARRLTSRWRGPAAPKSTSLRQAAAQRTR